MKSIRKWYISWKILIASQYVALSVKIIVKYKDNLRKQLIKQMLYSNVHSSNNKRTESLDNWEPAMVVTSLRGIYSLTVQGHAFKSREWVVEPTLRTRHSWVAWVDAKESRRLRTWTSASLRSRNSPSLNASLEAIYFLITIHFMIVSKIRKQLIMRNVKWICSLFQRKKKQYRANLHLLGLIPPIIFYRISTYELRYYL